MKRLLKLLTLAGLLVCFLSAGGYCTDLTVNYVDSLIGDDTTITSRVDTVYTSAMRIIGVDYLCFGFEYGTPDTNWADDSLYVGYQLSRDGINWEAMLVSDTILPGASAVYTLSPLVDTIVGRAEGVYTHLRGMAIHWDSLPAAADIQGETYETEFKFWVTSQE